MARPRRPRGRASRHRDQPIPSPGQP